MRRSGPRPATLFVLAALAASLVAAPALAQDVRVYDRNDVGDDDRDRRYGPEQGDWELTLTGSGSNDNDFDSGGFGASGSIGYFFTDGWEVILRQTVNFADSEDASSTTIGSTRIGVDYNIPLGRVYPFLGANIGGVYGNDIEETWAAAPVLGVKFFARQKTFLFAQAEYQFFFDDADEADEAFDDGIFVYSIGIGFNW